LIIWQLVILFVPSHYESLIGFNSLLIHQVAAEGSLIASFRSALGHPYIRC